MVDILATLSMSARAELRAAAAFLNLEGGSLHFLRYLLRNVSRTAFGRHHHLRPTMGIDEFRSALPIQT